MLQITLLPEVRSTLAAAFRLADLVRIDFSHDFSNKVKDEDLLDFELTELVRHRINEAGPNGRLALADPELLYLYGLLDLFCKSYFTSFADVLEKEHKASTGTAVDEYREQRDRHLAMAGRILQHLGNHLQSRPGLVQLLEKLALLEETML